MEVQRPTFLLQVSPVLKIDVPSTQYVEFLLHGGHYICAVEKTDYWNKSFEE